MTTLAEELCKPDVVQLVDAFVRICPSLLINHKQLAEAFRNVTARDPCERAGMVLRPARNWAWNVKMVLSHWRNIAVYPEKYARAMRQADVEKQRTISRLRASIDPFLEITKLEDLSTASGGTSQPSRSSPKAWPTASETGSTSYAAYADVLYDLELELLDDKLPPQYRRIIEGQLSQTLALSQHVKRAGQYALDAVGGETHPKRRKTVYDAAVETALEAMGSDAPSPPSGDATQTHEDLLGDKTVPPVTVKHCGLILEYSDAAAQQQTQMRRGDRTQGNVKQDRRATCGRAYKTALTKAFRDYCSREEAYKRARVAGQKAGEAWDDVNLWGNAV